MDFRKLLAFGTGLGVEIRDRDLAITMVRVRPSGVEVAGQAVIHGFRERPAAEWGAEYARFLKKHGGTYLSATVLLPRREVIVRQIALPGVSGRDLQGAIALQVDTLHPYGEDDVVYGWSRLDASGAVLVGLTQRQTLEHYLNMFMEAGIAVTSFTFSAAAIHGAIRLSATRPAGGFFAVNRAESGPIDVYGESESKPVLSAEFDLPLERAAALAIAELRLAPDAVPFRLHEILPVPKVNPIENDLSRNALPYATALAGACPRLAPAANLLPTERRSSNSRAMWIVPAVLAGLLLIATGALAALQAIEDKKHLERLHAEISTIESQARKAAVLDSETQKARNRARLLDDFRGRSKSDLDALNELTRLLPPPVWTNQIELTRDSVTISGEADQAAPLLKVLDASPYFQNSEFSQISRTATGESFRIRTLREAGR